jgi:hypothetical protein
VIAKVHCALYGHEWSAWQSASDLPIKVRACARCQRVDKQWLSGFKPEWQTRPPPPSTDKPTVLMRVWHMVLIVTHTTGAALRWLGEAAMGLGAHARPMVTAAGRWAHRTWKRLVAWFARLGGALSAAARTFRASMTNDRGEPR